MPQWQVCSERGHQWKEHSWLLLTGSCGSNQRAEAELFDGNTAYIPPMIQ